MAMLSSVVSALSTFYQDSHNPFDEQQRHISTIRLLAKLPTIAAYAFKKSVGHPVVYPSNDLGYVENFLRMTFSVPAADYDLDPVVVSALDKLLILHADHEQNCSTSWSVWWAPRRRTSSPRSRPVSTPCGGPLHGGANQSVLEMLEGIQRDGGDVDSFIRKVKNKEDGVKLMGFGHRVYKNFDPGRRSSRRRRTMSSPRSASPTSCWTSPSSWRSTRSPTTTSSRASSTRTSTSTPA